MPKIDPHARVTHEVQLRFYAELNDFLPARWRQHEFKAFQEFVERAGVRYEYIGFSVTGQQVVTRILENPLYREA